MGSDGARSGIGGARRLPDLIARNSLLNLLGLGLPLAVAVVAIPPLTAGLGSERFGILGLVWVVVAYLALLDLGLGRATTHAAAAALSRGAPDELRGIMGVAAGWQLGLGLVGGGVAALLAGPLVTRFLTLSPSLEREAALCFMILAAATPAVVITNGFRGLLEADQRFGFINAIRIPVSTANFAVPLVGVWLDWSLPGIVAWMVVTRLAALVAYASACLRAWPSLRGPLRVERERFGSLTRFGGWVTVSALVSALLVYADRFVAGALVSVEAVGYYTVPHEMVTRLEVLPASLVLTLFPALSGLSSRGGGTAAASEERARLVLRSIEYVLAFVGPLLVVLAAGGDDILSVWLGASFAERAATPLRILALGMLANAVAFVPAAALQAAGRPDIPAKFHLLELPLHLGVVWVLTARWGLVGAATAWSIRTALDAALLLGASSRLGFTRGAPTRVPRVVGALSVLAVGACGVVLAMHSAPWTLAGLAALGLLWAVWCWRSLLGPSERRRLLRALGGGPS